MTGQREPTYLDWEVVSDVLIARDIDAIVRRVCEHHYRLGPVDEPVRAEFSSDLAGMGQVAA